MLIKGDKINLRPASLDDKASIYQWLAHSDITHLMLGPPLFPETLAPTWEEFIEDYHNYYFDGSAPHLGRCFVIELNGKAIGQINYNEIDPTDASTELDIWLAERRYTGYGYGSDAIKTLCLYLKEIMACKKILIAPSRRNVGAIKAYQKAGFKISTEVPEDFIPDYEDTVILIKKLND